MLYEVITAAALEHLFDEVFRRSRDRRPDELTVRVLRAHCHLGCLQQLHVTGRSATALTIVEVDVELVVYLSGL